MEGKRGGRRSVVWRKPITAAVTACCPKVATLLLHLLVAFTQPANFVSEYSFCNAALAHGCSWSYGCTKPCCFSVTPATSLRHQVPSEAQDSHGCKACSNSKSPSSDNVWELRRQVSMGNIFKQATYSFKRCYHLIFYLPCTYEQNKDQTSCFDESYNSGKLLHKGLQNLMSL